MYETADLYSTRKSNVIARMIQETRAEVPEWTRDMNHNSGQRSADPATTVKPKAPAAVPTIAKRADALSEEFRRITRDCDSDIKKLQDRVNQINRDIIELSKAGLKSENLDAITALKAERDDLLKRIEKLRGIRSRALKEA